MISHEAAARLHGFDRCLPAAVEFTVSRERRQSGGLFRVHSTGTLVAIDRVTVRGFPCTSATRTIIDLARARIPEVRLEAAIDSAVRSGASAPSVLAARLAALRGPGRWGAGRRVYEYTYQQVMGQQEYVARTMRERLWSRDSWTVPRIR